MTEIFTLKFEVGNRIGDYTLLARCGQGAYGVVFLAENVITGQRVALKAVAAAGRNCERELKGLRQYQQICRRTNLLQIYHVGAGEDFFYYTMDAADPLDEISDMTDDTADVVISNQTAEEIAYAMNALTDTQKNALILKYYFGHSSEEIASIIGSNAQAVRTMLLRARRRLAKILKEKMS